MTKVAYAGTEVRDLPEARFAWDTSRVTSAGAEHARCRVTEANSEASSAERRSLVKGEYVPTSRARAGLES